VVVISELETTVKTAAVPLKLTPVEQVRLVPRILTAAPTLPEVGCVSTNGPRPTDNNTPITQRGTAADSGRCRSAFRNDVDQDYELMPITIPTRSRSQIAQGSER